MTEIYGSLGFLLTLLGRLILAVRWVVWKITMKRKLLLVALLLTACGGSTRPVTTVPARVWYPMLGAAQPGPIKRTPVYGIAYQDNGFGVVRPKQIAKTVKWLKAQGAGHLVDQFVAAANETDIAGWIDTAWETNIKQYRECEGKFARFAATTDPRTITITVEPVPMRHPTLDLEAGAMAYPDGRTIRCVIIVSGGMTTNPATADLRRFKDYVVWELGNSLAFRYGHRPVKIPEDEWGSHVPCRQVMK